MMQATKTLYEADFVQWSDRTAQLLREHRFADLDLDHLIEEVEDLGNRHRDALESQVARLLMHLLKWQFQPEQRSSSWLGSIKEARKQIKRLYRKYPSLKNHLEQCLNNCYEDAVEDASDETGLLISVFPAECPYAIADMLDPDFLPD
jgi:predicted  nucleic acid-binding Zn-ribbon protein